MAHRHCNVHSEPFDQTRSTSQGYRGRCRHRRQTRTPSMVYRVAESNINPISFQPTVSYSPFEMSSSNSSDSEYSVDYDTEHHTYRYCNDDQLADFDRMNGDYFYTYPQPTVDNQNQFCSGCEFCCENQNVCHQCGNYHSHSPRMQDPEFKCNNEIECKNSKNTKSDTNLPYTVEEPSSESDLEHVKENTINTGPTIDELSD